MLTQTVPSSASARHTSCRTTLPMKTDGPYSGGGGGDALGRGAWLRCRWPERQGEEVLESKDPLAYLLAESEGVLW